MSSPPTTTTSLAADGAAADGADVSGPAPTPRPPAKPAPRPFRWLSFFVVFVFGIFGQLFVRLGSLYGSLDKLWLLLFAMPPFSLVPALYHGFQLIEPGAPMPIWGRLSGILLLPLIGALVMRFYGDIRDASALMRYFVLFSVPVLTVYLANRDAVCAAIPSTWDKYVHALKQALTIVLGSLGVLVLCKNFLSEFGVYFIDNLEEVSPASYALLLLFTAFVMQTMATMMVQVLANSRGVPTCVPDEFQKGWEERQAAWLEQLPEHDASMGKSPEDVVPAADTEAIPSTGLIEDPGATNPSSAEV